MVDVRDDLAVLILHGRAHHHEHHRAAAPGLLVNLLSAGAVRNLVAGAAWRAEVERDLVAGTDWLGEIDCLAGVEAGVAKSRQVSEEMASVAEGDRERG